MLKMHKILFFVTGIGWGDSIRESSIIKELQKHDKFQIKIAGYRTSYNFFKDKFPTLRIKGFNTITQKFKFEFWIDNTLIYPPLPLSQEHTDSKAKTKILLPSKRLTYGILNESADLFGPYEVEVLLWE